MPPIFNVDSIKNMAVVKALALSTITTVALILATRSWNPLDVAGEDAELRSMLKELSDLSTVVPSFQQRSANLARSLELKAQLSEKILLISDNADIKELVDSFFVNAIRNNSP